MPLYVCNAAKGAIDHAAKPKIADDITRIHCQVTGAPPDFVHVFFFEDSPHFDRHGKDAFLFGSIRDGRTDAQKSQIMDETKRAIRSHSGLSPEKIAAAIVDTPASWVMEGGDLLPEPGAEADWLAAHKAKLAEAG